MDCSKLTINWKNEDEVIICQTWSNCQILFWRCRVLFVKFGYWSKFHVNIITCSKVMTIFVYKGLTRNPEIGNNPVCTLSIWRLGRVKNTKFGRNVSNEKLRNAATYLGTVFTVSELLKENQRGVKIRPTHIWVNRWTPNMEFPRIYFLVQILFLGTVLERFSQCNFRTFRRWPTIMADISTSAKPPPPPPPPPP